MLPAIPYSLVFIKYNPHRMAYWGVFIASLLSVGASGFFVYTSYPSTGIGKDGEIRIVSPYIVWMMGKNSRIRKHVETDWLAACWFFYWSSWLLVLGSYLLLCMADNDRQIFVYLTRWQRIIWPIWYIFFLAPSNSSLLFLSSFCLPCGFNWWRWQLRRQ